MYTNFTKVATYGHTWRAMAAPRSIMAWSPVEVDEREHWQNAWERLNRLIPAAHNPQML